MKHTLAVRLAALCLVALAACEGRAAAREVAALRGSEFVCADEVCTQRYPAMPDDGEWECLDRDGLVICRGGHGPAGAIAGPADTSFLCAALARDEERRRVCTDARPDLPSPDGWRCRFDRDGHEDVRRCEREAGSDASPRLGTRCEEDDHCAEGQRCVEGRCALASDGPPECWLDTDCEGGATCVLARCAR